MDVSVIVCTHNRATKLARALNSLARQSVPESLRWEVLVVDNASDDETPAVCREMAGRFPGGYRCLGEPRLGKSHALNRALPEAGGQLLLFTDDDIEADRDWLNRMVDAAARYGDAGFFGGRILPRWEHEPPAWLRDNATHPLLMGPAACLDHGSEVVFLDPTWAFPYFFGANFGLRRSVVTTHGLRFRADLGPRGSVYSTHEEVAYQEELKQRGVEGLYVGDALIFHFNTPERISEARVRAWHVGRGRSEVQLGQWARDQRHFLHAPLVAWKDLLQSALAFALTRFTQPPLVWLDHETRMARRWGTILEFWHRSEEVEDTPVLGQ